LNNAFYKINVKEPNYQHYILRITHEPAFSADPYRAFSLERLYQLNWISGKEFEEFRQYAKENSRHSMEHQWVKLEKLVEHNKIDIFCEELKQLLRQFGEDFSAINEGAIIILGMYRKTREQEIHGVISNDTIRLEYNKTRAQAIQLLKEFKRLWNQQIQP
jgi:hypothetical protein